MTRIVIASANAHKIEEIGAVMPATTELVPQTSLSIQGPMETGLTFVENAIIKARHAAQRSGLPAIADDSGLEVDYLGGEPGIYSARFAGEGASDDDNNRKLLLALEGVPGHKRTARFHCVIVYMRHDRDPTPIIAQGSIEGEIVTTPRGDNGFGYDPLFLIPRIGKTMAELSPAEKNEISHRAQALVKLQALLATTPGIP